MCTDFSFSISVVDVTYSIRQFSRHRDGGDAKLNEDLRHTKLL